MASIKVTFKEEKEVVIKGTPKVPKNLSKVLSNLEGTEKVYYIDKNYGLKHKLDSKMIFSSIHPSIPSMCEISIPIERI